MNKFIFSLALVVSSSAFAGDLEKTILTDLLKDGNKKVQNYCQIGSSKTVPVRDFFANYINWTLSADKAVATRSFNCKESAPGKNTFDCVFQFSEAAKTGEHPGWDMSLEFKYTKKQGVNWKSVQCVSTP